MIGERVVVQVATVPASAAAAKKGATVQTLVTFAAPPLPRLDLGAITNNATTLKSVTNVFDLNATASQFVFRGNKVVSGRRFGVLGKGQRLSIVNNTFIGLGSGAVSADFSTYSSYTILTTMYVGYREKSFLVL